MPQHSLYATASARRSFAARALPRSLAALPLSFAALSVAVALVVGSPGAAFAAAPGGSESAAVAAARTTVGAAHEEARGRAFREGVRQLDRAPPTSSFRILVGTEHAFALRRAHHNDWHYPDLGVTFRTPGFRMETRTVAPFALADGIIGAFQFLATGRSRPPPLMGLLNGDMEDSVGTTVLQLRAMGATRPHARQTPLVGGEFRMVLGAREVPATDDPDTFPESVRSEVRAAWILNQLGVVSGYEFRRGRTRITPAIQAGNGFGNLGLWNPFAAIEVGLEVNLPRVDLHGRLRGQGQRIDYRGYSSNRAAERELHDITLRAWNPSLTLQLGVAFWGAQE